MNRRKNGLESRHFQCNWTKLTVFAGVATALLLSLSSCNTMHGLGKDVEKAGEAIQKSTK
jgi:entericidin B